jgi:hypothetical protein
MLGTNQQRPRLPIQRNMARMASAKLIPLKDAPWAFASQRLRIAWQRAQDAPSSSKASRLSPASTDVFRVLVKENPAEAFKQMAEGFNGIIEDLRLRSVPEEAMQASVLEKLRDRKLEAWGVETAPERKRELEMLPPHFFMDAKISWSKNSVANLGATYSAVQVRRRPPATSRVTIDGAANAPIDILTSILSQPADQGVGELPAADFEDRAPTQPAEQVRGEGRRQKPGPPSGAEAVIAAYEELRKTGSIKDGMPISDVHRKLVKVLTPNTKAFPNGRGLAYASVARHLRSHLTGLSKFSS